MKGPITFLLITAATVVSAGPCDLHIVNFKQAIHGDQNLAQEMRELALDSGFNLIDAEAVKNGDYQVTLPQGAAPTVYLSQKRARGLVDLIALEVDALDSHTLESLIRILPNCSK